MLRKTSLYLIGSSAGCGEVFLLWSILPCYDKADRTAADEKKLQGRSAALLP